MKPKKRKNILQNLIQLLKFSKNTKRIIIPYNNISVKFNYPKFSKLYININIYIYLIYNNICLNKL